jgi:signal transduction histidine kinase
LSRDVAALAELSALADYLQERREPILRAWHAALDADPELTSFSNLSRAQFNDHIPAVLDAFEELLRAGAVAEAAPPEEAQQNASAAEHGLHRWQQGYDQRQTMREWTHLQLCLLAEFERYEASRPQLDPRAMALAHRAVARLCGNGVIESAARYAKLQQAEAAARLRDLEQAFEQLQQLERERAEGWRQAAHDLRGSVGIISNATAVLSRDLAEPVRAHFSQVLERGVSSLHTLLSDLIDVARLEAGHERRTVAPFDAARTLRNLCETMRSTAADGSLFLLTQGPDSLPVAGDEAKVLRIAQNLLLNAFKATERGGVRVVWESRDEHWLLSVQDTGPGFSRGPAAPLERALKQATEESHEVETRAASAAGDAEGGADPAPTLPSQSCHRAAQILAGEGIGLSIVKRLCELLDASLELETTAGSGTTFRVTFPRSYADEAERR